VGHLYGCGVLNLSKGTILYWKEETGNSSSTLGKVEIEQRQSL